MSPHASKLSAWLANMKAKVFTPLATSNGNHYGMALLRPKNVAGWLVTSDLSFYLEHLSVGCPNQSNTVTSSVYSYIKGATSNVEPILSVSVAHTVTSCVSVLHLTSTAVNSACAIVSSHLVWMHEAVSAVMDK